MNIQTEKNTYYVYINKNIKLIRCSTRRICFDGILELPTKKDSIEHSNDKCIYRESRNINQL